MDIIITNSYNENGNKGIEMTCGKTSAMIFKGGRTAAITTICKNASHKAWRGMGRTFRTWEEAKAAYKSSAMKSMIDHAEHEIG